MAAVLILDILKHFTCVGVLQLLPFSPLLLALSEKRKTKKQKVPTGELVITSVWLLHIKCIHPCDSDTDSDDKSQT